MVFFMCDFFLDFLKRFEIFGFFWVFSWFFFVIPFKVIWLQLKVTKLTTGYQKLPKLGQNSILNIFLPKGQKKPRAKALSRS